MLSIAFGVVGVGVVGVVGSCCGLSCYLSVAYSGLQWLQWLRALLLPVACGCRCSR